jgi:membrane peptidoglycan carboxypeptidase
VTRDRSSTPRGDRYAPRHASGPSSAARSGRTSPNGGRSAKGAAASKRRRPSNKPRGGRKSFLRRWWWKIALLTPVVLGLLVFLGLYIAYARLTLPETLPPIQTTYVYDRNGHLLTKLHGVVNRTEVGLDQISPHMIEAVIATEDHDFYNHPGVDIAGIMRAAYTDLVKRDVVQGASTITEQLVKNVYAGTYSTDENGVQTYTPPERTVTEKVREALLAIKLEQELGKDQILDNYLNTVYFGHGAYGVQAAAETYFGVPASKLTVLQSASLAGVLHAPELYDPIDRPYDNKFRRDYAIDQMVKYGYLRKKVGNRLKQHECCGTRPDQTERLVAPGQSEYFAEYVRKALFDRYGEGSVYSGGLQVTTTLDLNLQRAAEDAIATALPDQQHDPDAALVSIDPRTGQILAMAGGRNWHKNQFNYATDAGGTGRETGSAFKAFTLAAALNDGQDPFTYWNGPSTMAIPECPDPQQPDGVWHPVNAGDGEAGTFNLFGATAHSVNTIFAQLIAKIGPTDVVDMAHALGIQSTLDSVCSITLGSVAVNPLEMTSAYGTIADQGVRHDPTPLLQVRDASGSIDETFSARGDHVLDANIANTVTYALEGVVKEGTGTAASLGSTIPVAGKTGTANDNKDAWFCGYTVQIVTCVWIGYGESETPLINVEGVPTVYGGTIPAAIWHDYMAIAMEGQKPIPFPEPNLDAWSSPAPYVPPSPTYTPPPSSASPTPKPTKSPKPSESPSPTEPPSPSDTPSPSPTK